MQLPPTSPSGAQPHIDLVRGAAEAYARNSKSSLLRLQDVWQDIELPQSQQVAVLEDVICRAQLVWEEAVAAADATRQRLRGEVEAALREIAAVKEELGDDVMRKGAEAELDQLKGEERVHKSLSAWRCDVMQKAHYWRNCRLQRVAEYEELQALLRQARAQIGRPDPSPPAPGSRPDISRAALEYLRLELEKMRADKERREEALGALTQRLRVVCGEVGEEADLALAEVHESLSYMWGDSTARQVLRDVYKLAGSGAATQPVLAGGAGPPLQADLSDETLGKLQQKLDALANLKSQREAHASELMSILHSLWDACGVPPDAAERSGLVRLMGGPLRLHTRSLERCMSEVRRCEEAKVAQMMEIVNQKARELMDLCGETHIAPPDGLGACIATLNRQDGRCPGAAADLLTKLVRMLSEVQVVAAKRGAIIGGINELEEARREDEWLAEFEADEARYKGRDANKKLQRAIRAQKMRERLPAMTAGARQMLAEWKEAEGTPFLYDGRDYEALLEDLEQRLEFIALEKATKSHSRRRESLPGGTPGLASPAPAAGRGGAGAGAVAGAAAPPCASPAPRARTPAGKGMQGVTGRQLHERHSIAVVRPGGTARDQAQLMRSSGQISVGAPAHHTPPRPSGVAADLARPPRAPHHAVTPARTPQPGARRAAAAAAAPTPGKAAAATAAAGPTSDRLASIFNKSPLTQGVATLEDSSRAAGAAAAAAAAAAEVPSSAGTRTPTPDVGGAHRHDDQSGGGGLGAMYDRLVERTSASAGGGVSPAAAGAEEGTPEGARRGGGSKGAGGSTGSKGTPPGRMLTRIPQPQF